MLWIEASRQLSKNLLDPYELEFVWRGLKGLDKLAWLNLQSELILEKDYENLKEISKKLENHIPPQYIIGWADFCASRFKVDERVLIPRPETEELTKLILSENDELVKKVLDMGTGSGAIAISLAKARPNWEITASDISEQALELAHENADLNGAELIFMRSDVMDHIHEKFDLIISNPPYIAFEDDDEVDISVKTYEPKNALFAGNHGLSIYEKLAQQAPTSLNENGKIYLEIGHKQGAVLKVLFKSAFPGKSVSVYKDSFGKDRMLNVK